MPEPYLMAPFIPNEPTLIRTVLDIKDVYRWAVELRRELDRFLVEVHRHAATKSLVGTRAEQTVTAGFTITAEDAIICLTAAAPVTSDPTTAIQNGTDGQWLILANVGAQAITIVHGANTHLALDVDLALLQYECLHLIWTGSLWLEVA